MRRSICIIMVLFMFCLSGFTLSESRAQKSVNNMEIKLIAPPSIVKPVSFTVAAVITNCDDKEKIKLKKVSWKADKTFEGSPNIELSPAGDSRLIVEKLRAKKSQLSKEESDTLKVNYEKQKKGTAIVKLSISEDTAKKIINKGSGEIFLEVFAEKSGNGERINASTSVSINKGRVPGKPPVAPGAHHSDWYFGDTHSHSTYTWDYFFGDGIYTIPELKGLAMAAGLEWLVLTDHAYCLDSTKFSQQKNTVTSLCDSSFAFMYGEELSCAELVNGSISYDTCHYNGIMNSTFVPCSTDIFRKASSPDSQQGIDNIKSYGGLVTINHPNYGTGLLESWNFNINTYPYTHGETAMEILNGGWSDTNNGSATRWVDRRLLNGEKVFPVAGSDTESSNHFGECYTVLYADYLTQSNIKENLGLGHHYVTTYPGLSMWAKKAGTAVWSWMGDTLTTGASAVDVYVSYTDSVDSLRIYVMKGKYGWGSEQQIYSGVLPAGSNSFTINTNVEPGAYLRAYCVESADSNYRAYTTPIWFN